MNWLHFFLWIAGLYALYYLVVLLIDLAGAAGKPKAGTPANTLTFSEHVEPVQLQHQPPAETGGTTANKQEREVISSGGVSLKDLFNLARKESIIYTNPVSY